jgi:hypothetical protein
MRTLSEEEVRQLIFLRKCGGLTPDGEELYQRVMKGDYTTDDPYPDDDDDKERADDFLKRMGMV